MKGSTSSSSFQSRGKYEKVMAEDSSSDSESFVSDDTDIEHGRFSLKSVELSGHKGPGRTGFVGFLWKSLFSEAVWSCVVYSVTSISMVLANKLILTTFKFKFDMVLLFVQNLTSLVLLKLARALNLIEFESFERNKAMHWLPLNFFFVMMLFTGFLSIERLSVPMIVIFKNSANVVVTIGDFLFYRQTVSRGIVGCLALMLLASVLAAMNDIHLDILGITWAILNCIVSAGYVLYMPCAMEKTKLSTFGRVYYNCTLSLPLVLFMDFFVFRDFQKLYIHASETAAEFGNVAFISTLVFSGVVGFAISLASFNCVRKTSPTTYSMVGSLNKIPLTIIGVIMFKTALTMEMTVFVSLNLAAAILYAYTKAKEKERADMKKKREAEEQQQISSK